MQVQQSTDDRGREGHTLHGHLAMRDVRHAGLSPTS